MTSFCALPVASLLNCLHQLRQENQRLEEHIQTLSVRRDQLLAVNARLTIPLQVSVPWSLGQLADGHYSPLCIRLQPHRLPRVAPLQQPNLPTLMIAISVRVFWGLRLPQQHPFLLLTRFPWQPPAAPWLVVTRM